MENQLDQQLAHQLARVADALNTVSYKLDQAILHNNSNHQHSPEEQTNGKDHSLLEAIGLEAQKILQTAVDQFKGARPPNIPPDQLYGWSDAFSKQLGLKPPYPTSEVRQLEELTNQVNKLIKTT